MNIKQIAKELAIKHGGKFHGPNIEHLSISEDNFYTFINALIGDSEPVGEVYNKNQKYVYMIDTDLEFQHGTKLYTKPPSLIAKEAEITRLNSIIADMQKDMEIMQNILRNG